MIERGKTYVRDTQRGKVVALAKLAAHPLALAARAAVPQRRRDIRALLSRARPSRAGTPRHRAAVVGEARGDVGGAGLADGGHGLLVGAAGGEVLLRADAALDLLVLELVLHALGVGVLALVLGLLLPVGRGPEDDVLADRGGVGRGPRGVAAREAKLGPLLALGDARVDDLAVGDEADAAGGLDGLAVLVEAVGDDGLCAVAVLDGLIAGEGGAWDLFVVVVVGPVPARVVNTMLRGRHGMENGVPRSGGLVERASDPSTGQLAYLAGLFVAVAAILDMCDGVCLSLTGCLGGRLDGGSAGRYGVDLAIVFGWRWMWGGIFL